jgi:hypothetical protein
MGRAILQGAALAAALVIFGVFTTPGFIVSRGGPVGAAAVLGVLAAYGLAARFGASRASPETVRLAGRFALAAGGVYVAEIVLEYGLLPRDNTPWGLAEFGLVFLLVAAAGATAAWRARRLRTGLLAGVWTAMGASLIWYAALLAVFYAFRGTPQQEAVLRAEGDFEDFRRSGLADLRVFLMGDMLGAGFYHLLLSPVFGAILGGLGGLVGLAARKLALKS